MYTKENNLSPEVLIPGYLRGELTPEEKKELISWIKSDPANKRRYDEYCEIWITAQAGIRHPEYNYHAGFWKFKQKIRAHDQTDEKSVRSARFRNFLRYAAIVIIAVSLSGLLFYYINKNRFVQQGQLINELTVPLGSSARFSLSDGTTITLNAGSSLKYDNCFGIRDRVVTLEGEAFFNVAGQSDKLFTVRTSHLNVMALGTTFNVKAYSNDRTIETTLVEGSLQIEGIADKGSKEVITVLKPNQKLTFFKEDSTLREASGIEEKNPVKNDQPVQVKEQAPIHKVVTENVNVEPVISWKENKWIFEMQSLEKIAIELERKFDVKILFESERLKAFRFTGTIIAEPIEQVLEFMSISAPINFSLKGKVVTLSENKDFEKLNIRLYNQQ